MRKLAMIAARMGSQRLKQKNLRELGGVTLIARAIRRAKLAGVFDEVWVNSEHPAFGEIAEAEGALFHQRPASMASHESTSEEFVYEFLKTHPCDYVFLVHSIAPLLTIAEVRGFVDATVDSDKQVMLSYVPEQIECAMDGKPVNFHFGAKQNSQDLRPIQRVTWSITGWHGPTYIEGFERDGNGTYAGKIGFHPISRAAGHIIKTEEDLELAEAMLPFVESRSPIIS
jgi:CMP-N-acetylneuraminic acid synthetase